MSNTISSLTDKNDNLKKIRKLKRSKRKRVQDSEIEEQEKKHFMKWLNLAANCGYNGYRIKELSKENGDCLFESILLSSGKFSSELVSEFKKDIAIVLLENKTNKYLENLEGTLEQVFINFNDIPGYTYDDMVEDITYHQNWTRINTHLLLNIMSKHYKLDFIIINNTSTQRICISTHNSDVSKEIPLGHLLEHHYVPLTKIV